MKSRLKNYYKEQVVFYLFFFLCHCLHGQLDSLLKYEVSISDKNKNNYYFFSPLKVSPKGNSLPVLMILDGSGDLVYLKPFSKGPFAGNFRTHDNGLMSYYFDGKYFIMDSTFKIIDSVFCKNKLEPDGHEFLILPNGHYILIANEHVKMDLSSYKYFLKKNAAGSKNAKVTCNVIQELDVNKNVVFEWHAKNYYQFSDVDPVFLNDTATVDWMHFNSVDVDADGNLLISVKNFNEVTKVNRSNGSIIWRFGGKKNQFRFTNDSLKFRGQHDVRETYTGSITLFDNGRAGTPFHPEGGKEYKLDEKKLKAELVWSYINKPNTCSSGYGSVCKLKNGNTLINYGRSDNANTVFTLLSSSGEKIFEITSQDSIINYRAYMSSSLPFKINRPAITSYYKDGQLYLQAENGHSEYFWSTGEKTQTIRVSKALNQKVCVPVGENGFLVSLPFQE